MKVISWNVENALRCVPALPTILSRTAQDTHPRLRTEETHARARAEFNARMAEAGFVDIWRERHPTERAYTWFNRRARALDAARVDYILVSSELARRIGAADILDLLPWSDHAPVVVELRDPQSAMSEVLSVRFWP